jgi:hypothetical protein
MQNYHAETVIITYYLLLIFYFTALITSLAAPDTTYSTTTTIAADKYLSSSNRIIFNTSSIFFRAAGFSLQCPITPDPVIIVNAGITCTFQSMLIRDFNDAHLSFGNSSSSIIFNGSVTFHTILDQTLTHTLKLSGTTNFFIGNNNRIDMGTGCIAVQAGGSLTIANVNLVNVTATNLGCVDDTGSITFSNVSISTPGSWNWKFGSFAIDGNMEITDGIFAYTSSITSSILSNSKLRLSNNVTFSYAPKVLSGQTKASPLNLTFTDASSWLSLNGCSLCVTRTGLQLLKGSLEIIGKNYLYSDALTTTMPGLILGDGTDPDNDFQVKKFNANLSNINVKKGFLTYQNAGNTPIKYGNAIVLKHKNYGTYLKVSPSLIAAAGTNWHTLCCASTKPTDSSARFFIERPGNGTSRFDGAGTQVRSGDIIRLESVSLQGSVDTSNGTTNSNCGSWLYLIYNQFLPPVSTPMPPYQAITLHYDTDSESQYVTVGNTCRIYKNGGNIGDFIMSGDNIYIVSWYYDGTYHPIYLGSSNLSYTDGKEAYIYCDTTTGQPKQPPSFTSNFLWTIAENTEAAYQTAVNVRYVSYGFDLTGWPDASTYQW